MEKLFVQNFLKVNEVNKFPEYTIGYKQIISICDRDNVRCRLLATKPANPNETSFQNIQTPKITWKLTETSDKNETDAGLM